MDQARVALRKMWILLRECDQDTTLKALEAEDSVKGTIHIHVFRKLKRDRISLQGDIDLLEEKECYTVITALEARKLRLRSEKLERKTYVFSEGIRDIIKTQCETFSNETRQFTNLRANGPSLDDSSLRHPESEAQQNTLEAETILKIIREACQVAPTASQPSAANIIYVNNSYINQNSSISHSSLRLEAANNISTHLYICPDCPPALSKSFDSPSKLKAHLYEVHRFRKLED